MIIFGLTINKLTTMTPFNKRQHLQKLGMEFIPLKLDNEKFKINVWNSDEDYKTGNIEHKCWQEGIRQTVNIIYDRQMEKRELIYLATIVDAKDYDYEKMMYSDYMYGKTHLMDKLWVYVEELQDYGRIAFYKKYKDYKLY